MGIKDWHMNIVCMSCYWFCITYVCVWHGFHQLSVVWHWLNAAPFVLQVFGTGTRAANEPASQSSTQRDIPSSCHQNRRTTQHKVFFPLRSRAPRGIETDRQFEVRHPLACISNSLLPLDFFSGSRWSVSEVHFFVCFARIAFSQRKQQM